MKYNSNHPFVKVWMVWRTEL